MMINKKPSLRTSWILEMKTRVLMQTLKPVLHRWHHRLSLPHLRYMIAVPLVA